MAFIKSKKVYAILMNDSEGRKIVEKVSDMTDEQLEKELDAFFGNRSTDDNRTYGESKGGGLDNDDEEEEWEWSEEWEQAEKEKLKKKFNDPFTSFVLDSSSQFTLDQEDLEKIKTKEDLLKLIFEYQYETSGKEKKENKDFFEHAWENEKTKEKLSKKRSVELRDSDIQKPTLESLDQLISEGKKYGVKVSSSPYGSSLYITSTVDDNIDWGEKPRGSLRISDHYSFESRGEYHTKLKDKDGNYLQNATDKDGNDLFIVAQYDDMNEEYKMLGYMTKEQYNKIDTSYNSDHDEEELVLEYYKGE